MTDIHTKILQDIPLKQRGHEVPSPPSGISSPEAIEKARQTIDPSNSSELNSNAGGREQGKSRSYTVLIAKGSGEIRAISMKAGSPEEAKVIARSGLEQGETISSVDESTVPPPPDPDRGLVA